MNTKKLIVFLLWAFLPMVIVGVLMQLSTFNAVVPLSAIVVTPANDLLYGAAGLAGFIVLLIMDVFLYLYDKYINKEKVFATVL